MQLQTVNIRTGLLLMILSLDSTIVLAEESTLWINSHGATLVNRSTLALSAGRLQRGLRTAWDASRQKLDVADRLIVNHNLCLALLQSGETERAVPYCTSASTAAQAFRLVRLRGAYLIVKPAAYKAAESLSLSAVILGNIYNNSDRLQMVWGTGSSQLNPLQGHVRE